MKVINMQGEMTNNKASLSPTQWVKDYWFIFVALVSIVASFVTLQSSTKALESRVVVVEFRQQQITNDISDIKQSVSAIDASLEFIKSYIQNQ